MKNKACYLIIIACLFYACEKDNFENLSGNEITETSTRVQDDKLLDSLYQEIVDLSTQFGCDDSEEWDYAAIGSKPCGGAAEYIAYSSKLDVPNFLKKVEHMTILQMEYNEKWGVISNCYVPQEPKGIECIDGSPEFIY